jgi:hypothetical protein
MREQPSWDDATLIVLSDHGTSFTLPDVGRNLTEANREEVLRMPLFIKAPGQPTGEIRDDSASTLDVLPSLVDLLDIETDWAFTGHSLYDGTDASAPPAVSTDIAPVLGLAAARAQQFPHGDDWTGLAAVGEHGDLVGRAVADLPQGDPSAVRAVLGQAELFASLPTEDGRMPFVLGGRASGGGGESPPPELLVAVNGTLAGVVGGYRPDGDGWTFTGFVGEVYREGSNDVRLFEARRDGGMVTLHPVSG